MRKSKSYIRKVNISNYFIIPFYRDSLIYGTLFTVLSVLALNVFRGQGMIVLWTLSLLSMFPLTISSIKRKFYGIGFAVFQGVWVIFVHMLAPIFNSAVLWSQPLPWWKDYIFPAAFMLLTIPIFIGLFGLTYRKYANR